MCIYTRERSSVVLQTMLPLTKRGLLALQAGRLRGPAGVAHLVERHLAKVEVAGSSPVARSTKDSRSKPLLLLSIWRHSQVVRRGSAKP